MFWDYTTNLEKLNIPAFVIFVVWPTVQYWMPNVDLPAFWWYRLARFDHDSTGHPKNHYRVSGLAPFQWVYTVSWWIMNGLTSIAIYIYWQDFNASVSKGPVYGTILLVWFSNVALMKFWAPTFFSATHNNAKSRFVISSIIAFLVFLSAVAVVVMLIVDKAWLSFGLYVAYPIWLLYPLAVNIQFATLGDLLFSDQAKQEYLALEQRGVGRNITSGGSSHEHHSYEEDVPRLLGAPILVDLAAPSTQKAKQRVTPTKEK